MKIVPLFIPLFSRRYFVEFYQVSDQSRLSLTVSWIVDLVVMIALAVYVVYLFGSRVEVVGGSMKPVLNSGDVVLMNRLAYTLGSPERFDIAVFERESSGLNLKRIIGLPGETVQIIGSQIYINGELLEADEAITTVTIAGLAEYPIELGEDEYFLLGDNRDSSEDSRFASIGNIKRSQLVGKAWLLFKPFSSFGRLSMTGGTS
ncbi:MAG: signal peptidase I [Lachnospiraceae bacterium]|jgi:signal peptidase I|nr:signal peptidase I [Lachnospiraceae bacterium]NBJ80465.1 signal peptidase I [bacterium 1XD42-76]NBK03674.1 signal peptidase I [bacterium 1XD42-94]